MIKILKNLIGHFQYIIKTHRQGEQKVELKTQPSFLYTPDQNRIRNKVQSNLVLDLRDALIIVEDANLMKMTKPQRINPYTNQYELDRDLVNDFIRGKYGYPIYYKDAKNEINLLMI